MRRPLSNHLTALIASRMRLGVILCLTSCAPQRYSWDIDCVGCSSATPEEAAAVNANLNEEARNRKNVIGEGNVDDAEGLDRAIAKALAERRPSKTHP